MTITCIGASSLVQESLSLVSGPIWQGSISKPAGTSNGHQMLTFVLAERLRYPEGSPALGTSVTQPGGWSLIFDEEIGDWGVLKVYSKIANSEGSSYTWQYQYNDSTEKYTTMLVVYDQPLTINATHGINEVWSPANNLPLVCSTLSASATQLFIGVFQKIGGGSMSLASQSPSPISRVFATTGSVDYGMVVDHANQGAGSYGPYTNNIVDYGEAVSLLFDMPIATGTASFTLGALTVSATAQAKAQAASSFTLGALTISATAIGKISGSANLFFQPLTIFATTTSRISGSATITLGALTIAATSGLRADAAGAFTFDNLTLSATAIARASGTLAITLDDLTVSAEIAGNPKAQLAVTLDDLTIDSEAVSIDHGAAAIVLADLTIAATATVKIQAQLAVTLEDLYMAPNLAGAYAIATHTIRVLLSAEPQHTSAFLVGDALNPSTWTVQRLADGFAFTVIGVVMHDSTTADVTVLEALGSHLVGHKVQATGMLGVGGAGTGADLVAVFPGVVQTLDPVDVATGEAFRARDLANPPFQVERGIGYSGTLIIGSDGDYETEAGAALLRKLVMRRLGTKKNAFRHLPGYGIGFAEKEPVPSAGDLLALKRDIEDQTLQEPEAAEARASLTITRDGVLIVQLGIRAQDGTTISIRMGSIGGHLVEM